MPPSPTRVHRVAKQLQANTVDGGCTTTENQLRVTFLQCSFNALELISGPKRSSKGGQWCLQPPLLSVWWTYWSFFGGIMSPLRFIWLTFSSTLMLPFGWIFRQFLGWGGDTFVVNSVLNKRSLLHSAVLYFYYLVLLNLLLFVFFSKLKCLEANSAHFDVTGIIVGVSYSLNASLHWVTETG